MKVIIFGATGMVGRGVLHECLLAPDVEQVLVVGRRSTGVRHAKLREVTLADFADLTPIEDELGGYDACFYCLGVSSVGLDEAAYTRISYDYPIAAARTLAMLSPDMTFIYVSGAGTKADGRAMWARVKARTEAEVIRIFPHGYGFRPAFIQPAHDATASKGLFRVAYLLTGALMPVLDRLFPRYVTSTDRLGQAMLRAARTGFATRIVENADLR